MRKVGEITPRVAELLEMDVPLNVPIMLGKSNIEHMRETHEAAYIKYGDKIQEILATPDLVGRHPTNGSIEYVKEFVVDGEYVKVAVRISNSGSYFARTLYVLDNDRVKRFIEKGTLKRVT